MAWSHAAESPLFQDQGLVIFSVMLVSKLLLTPIKIRIFCPKKTKIGPKYAFLVILGQILPFFAHFVQCPTKNQCEQIGILAIAGSFGALLVGWLVVVALAVSRKSPIYFIHIVFWSGIGQKVQKMAIFGPK